MKKIALLGGVVLLMASVACGELQIETDIDRQDRVEWQKERAEQYASKFRDRYSPHYSGKALEWLIACESRYIGQRAPSNCEVVWQIKRIADYHGRVE